MKKRSARATRAAKHKTRVLLVDDHPMMRDGLAQLIAGESDLEICGEAGDAAQALEVVGARQPELVLTDISLPDKNGLELTKDILAMHPTTLVLVISMHDEALYAGRVLRAGARGYIMKQEGGKKFLQAIRAVHRRANFGERKDGGKPSRGRCRDAALPLVLWLRRLPTANSKFSSTSVEVSRPSRLPPRCM